jgi:phosphoribosylamine--glycine ligase
VGGLLPAAARGELADHPPPRWRPGAAVTVVVASAGYPGTPRTGDPIEGADRPGVLHAGTRLTGDGTLVSAGGRVLSCTGTGPSVTAAREAAYGLVAGVTLAGSQHRTDIASPR